MRRDPDSRRGALAFSLLISSLFHALLIFVPYFAKVTGREGVVAVGAYSSHMALRVTLNHPGEVAKTTPVRAKVPRLRRELGNNEFLRKAAEEELPHASPAAVPPLLPPYAMDYYATNELTVEPQALGEPVLDPEKIASIVVSGRIILMLWIDDRGEVADVAVEDSDLPEAFSLAAIMAFRNLRFTPGESNGKKVGVVMRVEVRYDDARVLDP